MSIFYLYIVFLIYFFSYGLVNNFGTFFFLGFSGECRSTNLLGTVISHILVGFWVWPSTNKSNLHLDI